MVNPTIKLMRQKKQLRLNLLNHFITQRLEKHGKHLEKNKKR